MSDNFVGRNDPGWEKFVRTGSIYDYLNYRNCGIMNIDIGKDIKGTDGGSCENRNQRSSS